MWYGQFARKSTKWILLIIAQDKEWTLNGGSIHLQMLQCLLRYSKLYPWVVMILYYLKFFWKTKMWTALLSREIRENLTMTTSACLGQLLYICMATISWKGRVQKFSTFFNLTAKQDIRQRFKVFIRTTFQDLKTCCSSLISYMILISLTENSFVNLLV